MTPVRYVQFESPITDPAGGSVPKRGFSTGIVYTVTRDGDVFTVTSVCSGVSRKCNFRAEWEDVETAEPKTRKKST